MIKTSQTAVAADFVITAVAGENITANDAVYILASDGKAYQCDADNLGELGFIGFAQETITSGNNVTIKTSGLMTGFSGLTIGAEYFLSATQGAITSTAPTNFKAVGTAMSATVIRIATYLTKRVRTYVVADSPATWTKFAALKYIDVEVIGGGGDGASSQAVNGTSGSGGGGGGYSRKRISASALGSTETITIGAANGTTSFGAHCQATGGVDGTTNGVGGDAGIGSGGDLNIAGQGGGSSKAGNGSGEGGSSHFGGGAPSVNGNNNGSAGRAYGGGGSGGNCASDASTHTGGAGMSGIAIVTEWY